MKPKIKKTKLTQNPLFIKFLNWKKDIYSVETWLENIEKSLHDGKSKEWVTEKLKNLNEEYIDNLITFQKKFKTYLTEVIQTQNLKEEFIFWLNNSFKYIKEIKESTDLSEYRSIKITSEEGRWLEAIICYNFILTFNYFGIQILKICPICKNFFAHKGPYAKYCSEGCKEIGKKK